jgi:hypothetical protein
MNLTEAAKTKFELQAELAAHIAASKQREAELRSGIEKASVVLASSASGIDHDKIALAKTVIYVRGLFEHGGRDRDSVIQDAIKQLSTGVAIREIFGDLWRVSFGTKNYAQWSGQRSDHDYGYGPKHGSICFAVGLTDSVRKEKKHSDLLPEEIEATVYYLTNIQRVQAAEEAAKQAAAA